MPTQNNEIKGKKKKLSPVIRPFNGLD